MKTNLLTKLNKLSKVSAATRSNKGQAIAEGSAMLAVMVPICALLILLLVNTYFYCSWNFKVQQIAARAARRASEARWWLGMERDDFEKPKSNPSESTTMLENAIYGEIIHQLLAMDKNLVATRPVFTYTYTNSNKHGQSMLQKKGITIVKVDFNVMGIHSAKGFFFPNWLTIHGCGVSTDADHCITPHGLVNLKFVTSDGNGLGVRVPAYGASDAAGGPASPTRFHFGPCAGTYAGCNLKLLAKHEGVINLVDNQPDGQGNFVPVGSRLIGW